MAILAKFARNAVQDVSLKVGGGLPLPIKPPMFKLGILNHSQNPIPDFPNSYTETWRDNGGVVCAIGGTTDAYHWMDLPSVGTFTFCDDSELITAFIPPENNPDLVIDAFYRTIIPMALQTRGQQVLHASAVRHSSGVIALTAVSETGKSTLGFALSKRGYDQWADDAVAIQLTETGADTISLPFRTRLRPQSADFFNRDTLEGYDAAGWREFTMEDRKRVPLSAVFVLQRADTSPHTPVVTVERLSAGEAFSAILTHAYCFSLDDEARKRQMMQTYLALAARIPIFELRFQSGLHHLDSILDAIEGAVQT